MCVSEDSLNPNNGKKIASKMGLQTEGVIKSLPMKTAKQTVEQTVMKTAKKTDEEKLDARIQKIREQNESIMRRAREIEADKQKASRGRSHVL